MIPLKERVDCPDCKASEQKMKCKQWRDIEDCIVEVKKRLECKNSENPCSSCKGIIEVLDSVFGTEVKP